MQKVTFGHAHTQTHTYIHTQTHTLRKTRVTIYKTATQIYLAKIATQFNECIHKIYYRRLPDTNTEIVSRHNYRPDLRLTGVSICVEVHVLQYK